MAGQRTADEPEAFYVSCEGNDAWSGTRAQPGRDGADGPFASLERARDAIRALKKEGGLPPGGVTVWIRGGNHTRERTFTLTQEDSGTEESPITYRASQNEEARLLGGRVVRGFGPVTDAEVRERLAEHARPHVLQADLRAEGITDFGRLRSRGYSRPAAPAHLELFFNGTPMTLARWPNNDFVKIAKAARENEAGDGHGGQFGLLEAGFHYEGDRPTDWKTFENVWVHGYWAYDWANSYEEVESIDTEKRLVKTKPPHGHYGFREGQRYCFLNVLEELDCPGEYYVDAGAGMLYLWPPAPVEKAEVLVSVLETPMVSLQDVSHVTLRGLTFEATRGSAVEIKGGAGNLIGGCTIRNIGSHAVVIEGGSNHAVCGCDIYETGDSGIEMQGGDRKTLMPCGHLAHNNHIHQFARWSRCYCPAVHLTGVGMRVSHNLIHDAPHTAVLYLGNENIIEFNEIYHVTLETGDCGAIYTGRDFTARGNIIRHNYIHDTGGYGSMGSSAFYFDDCVSGQTLFGNICWNTTCAVLLGGGREIVVENNIFVDCVPAVHVDARGLDPSPNWHEMVYVTMKERLEAVNYREPPYSERYPELLQLDAYYATDGGIPPGNNIIARNICVGGQWLDVRWNAEEKDIEFAENLVDVDPRFVDAEKGDFRLRDDSPAWPTGFKPIPVEEIGLVRDDYRPTFKKGERGNAGFQKWKGSRA